MNRLKRFFKKTSFTTILFFLISVVSLTFAWFGYSGTSKANMELEVLAWHISFDNDSTLVSFDVQDIMPGMNDYKYEVVAENKGDVNAKLSYKIKKLRVLNQEYEYDDNSQFETLFNSFPFEISINITNENLLVGQSTKYNFEVKWPFEQGDDETDTYWGERVYEFKQAEKEHHQQDPSYEIKNPLSLEVELIATQGTPINFTIEGVNYKSTDGTTWGEWIQNTGGTSDGNTVLWVSLGCNKTDSEITQLQSPYNQDTRANNRYCALYLESSRASGQTPNIRLTNSSNQIQKYNDIIFNNESYKRQSS